MSTTSIIIRGLMWVVEHARGPAVLLMSLASRASPTLDEAVLTALRIGLTVVVAAGNYETGESPVSNSST